MKNTGILHGSGGSQGGSPWRRHGGIADGDLAARELRRRGAASTKRNLAGFTSQLKARGCTGQLEAVRSRLPASALASTAGIQVTGARVSGGRGFLLYRDAHGTTTAFPIVREGQRGGSGRSPDPSFLRMFAFTDPFGRAGGYPKVFGTCGL